VYQHKQKLHLRVQDRITKVDIIEHNSQNTNMLKLFTI